MKRILYFILILFLLSVPIVSADLTDGLVTYWDGSYSGTTAIDIVGNNNITATGTPFSDYGKFDKGFDNQNSSSNRLYSSLNTNFNNLNHTFSLWVYPYDTTTDGYMLNARTATLNNRLSLLWYPANSAYDGFAIVLNTPSTVIKSDSVDTANAWYHVVYTNDGTTSKLYVNGVNINSASFSSNNNIDEIFLLTSSATGAYLSGKVSDVAVWNRSMNTTEILELYNSGDGLAYPFSVSVDPVNISSVSIDTNSTSVFINEPFSFNITYLPTDATDVTISIDFDDISTSTSFTGTKSYSAIGLYNMSVVATDNLSNNAYDFVMINVTEAVIPEPEPVNLTNVSFSATDGANNSISGFSVSVNDDEYFGSTTTDTLIIELPEDTINNTTYKLVYSKFGYYTSSYDDINLSSLEHEGILVAKSYIGDESLDDKAIIWILLAITGGIGASSIFAKPMLVIFGFWLLFMTYFLSNNIMVAYYWFAPLGYVLGAIVILTGMLRLGFGEKF